MWENLSLRGRRSLKKRLSANMRLQTGYLFKESFDHPWGYLRDGWARRFFGNGKESLQWQRLEPFETIDANVERNRSGVASYCEAGEKFFLGFVEGVKTKIRVTQRRAYVLRGEESLRRKVLICMRPEIGNGHIPSTRLRDEPETMKCLFSPFIPTAASYHLLLSSHNNLKK